MEFDWRFYSFLLGIGQILVTVFGFALIKFNDFRHLTDEVQEIKKDQKEIKEKLDTVNTSVAVLKQRVTNVEINTLKKN